MARGAQRGLLITAVAVVAGAAIQLISISIIKVGVYLECPLHPPRGRDDIAVARPSIDFGARQTIT